MAVAGFFFGSPMGIDNSSSTGIYGSYSEDHPWLAADKGDARGGPGDMAGGAVGKLADKGGQAAGNYFDGGLPNGYPVEFGPEGGDEYDEDLMDYAGKK
jgi:hypothetical protein